jgi:hypothetical protein
MKRAEFRIFHTWALVAAYRADSLAQVVAFLESIKSSLGAWIWLRLCFSDWAGCHDGGKKEDKCENLELHTDDVVESLRP